MQQLPVAQHLLRVLPVPCTQRDSVTGYPQAGRWSLPLAATGSLSLSGPPAGLTGSPSPGPSSTTSDSDLPVYSRLSSCTVCEPSTDKGKVVKSYSTQAGR
eukprot:913431-Rhodomonas_salina.1